MDHELKFERFNQPLKRALISVSDKSGLAALVSFLVSQQVEIFATSSTRLFISDLGFPCLSVEELTGFPEILSGRVKTLHPAIFAGILGRTRHASDAKDLDTHNLKSFDLVVCNLYPFAEVLKNGAPLEVLYENIDIGGVTLLRAAAKNVDYTSVLTDPNDYPVFRSEVLKNRGLVNFSLRQALSLKAFRETASYDSLISSSLAEQCSEIPAELNLRGALAAELELSPTHFPTYTTLSLVKTKELRYGENPHQKAAIYRTQNFTSSFKSGESFLGYHLMEMQIHGGKELSYNNCLDIENALSLVAEFSEPVCVIVKHNVPCGVSWGQNSAEVLFVRAFESDKVSPFGGVVVFNQDVDLPAAKRLNEIFLEVIVAPSFTDDALAELKKKKNLRLVTLPFAKKSGQKVLLNPISGGYLVQNSDNSIWQDADIRWVSGAEPNSVTLESMRKAMAVAKSVRSNAIVIANTKQTIAVGGGFTNRVDAVAYCLEKATLDLNGSIVASDAFFPFPDSISLLAAAGASWIVQPGGSIQDEAVIHACKKAGIGMILTGERHFRH